MQKICKLLERCVNGKFGALGYNQKNAAEMRVWDAPQHIFNYAFDEVASIFYNRYPNSFAGHILSEDVLTREITKDRIISRKLIVKNGLSDLFFVL